MTKVADVFANRYEIERELAKGGMADVYVARDRQLKRRVAVKVLFSEFARDPNFVERFRREAQNAASLNHPNIAAVFDWGQERGTYYIVMEFVEGRSLRDIIRTDGPLPATVAARIAAELADALAFAHRHGVVHRDVKPGNVLITARGQVRLTDFGIASNQFDANQGLTQTGAVMGTATYFSPEQAQGHPVDGRSDVYSLGVVLYEMLAGVPPFTGESPVAVAMKHVREIPAPMSARVPDVPPQLEAIVNAALTKDIALRYGSADEMRVDLVDFERGRPLTFAYEPGPEHVVGAVAPPSVAAAATMPVAVHHRRTGWGGVVATIIALGLLGAVVVWVLVSNERSKDSIPTVEVPTVLGQQYDAAAAAVTNAGFKVVRVDDEAAPGEPGKVLAQVPTGGKLADEGSSVTLTVISTEITLPDVTGQPFDVASATLQRAAVGVTRANVDSEEIPGTVIGMDPAAQTKAAKGSTVTLQVAVEPGVNVPAVAGRSQGDALGVLRSVEVSPTVVQQASDAVPPGAVIGTDPSAGTRVTKGATVRLIVSSGPAGFPVPDVVGQTQGSATSNLLDQGFNVVVNFTPSPGPKGVVVSQNPAGGRLPRGATVTIFVSN